MAYEFNGTNYLSAASSPISGQYPFTTAIYTKVATNTTRYPITLGRSGANNNTFVTQIYPSSTNARFAMAVYGQTATGAADGTTNLTFDAFQHAAAVAVSTTSRSIITNGSNKVTNGSNTGSMSPNLLAIWAFISINGSGTYSASPAGFCAEVAIWSTDLTDAEITSLSKGFKPYRIRPQSLAFYAPLIRNLQDIKAGLALTNNNTATVTDHPRVY